jgi:hypothetical protein
MQLPGLIDGKQQQNADWDHFDWLQIVFGFQVGAPTSFLCLQNAFLDVMVLQAPFSDPLDQLLRIQGGAF